MTLAAQLKTQLSESIDANDDTEATSALELDLARNIFVSVEAVSGAHTTHVLTVQMSADSVTWHDSSLTVTGLGFVEGTINARFMRVRVSTEEAGASIVDVRVQAKPS